MFAHLLSSLLAITGVLAVCGPSGVEKANTTAYPNVICDGRGHLRQKQPSHDALFYAASYESCIWRCKKDYNCFVLSYQQSTGSCTFYYSDLASQGYYADASSDVVYVSANLERSQWE